MQPAIPAWLRYIEEHVQKELALGDEIRASLPDHVIQELAALGEAIQLKDKLTTPVTSSAIPTAVPQYAGFVSGAGLILDPLSQSMLDFIENQQSTIQRITECLPADLRQLIVDYHKNAWDKEHLALVNIADSVRRRLMTEMEQRYQIALMRGNYLTAQCAFVRDIYAR